MLYKEIKNKSKEDLLNLVDDLKAELFLLRFKNKTGQGDGANHKIGAIRKDIARVLTALREQELKALEQSEKREKGAK